MGLIRFIKNKLGQHFQKRKRREELALSNYQYESPKNDFKWMFVKQCKIIEVYDGDTCRVCVIIDSAPAQFVCRLMGIDAPEIKIKGVVQPKKNDPEYNQKMKVYCDAVGLGLRSRFAFLSQATDMPEFQISPTQIKNIQSYVDNDGVIMINPLLQITDLSKNKKILEVQTRDIKEKFGRLLVDLYDNEMSINDWMLKNKFAYAYDGGTKLNTEEINEIVKDEN